MLDITAIRRDPQAIREALAKRQYDVDFTDFLAWDEQRRTIIGQSEAIKAQRNAINRDIPRRKKAGEDITALLQEMKQSGEQVKELDTQLKELDERITAFVAALPNLPADDVVAGGKESNQAVRHWGEQPAFEGFTPQDHMQLAANLKLIDYERGVKLGGNGYWLYTGMGARLEWALLNYCMDAHTRDGYEMLLPPHLLSYDCGFTAGQFPKFEEDVFRLDEERFTFLLPTSETALVNLYRDEILPESELPRRFFAYSPCYRREAGSYRANERGMIRGHQFNKVEMFAYTLPEQSADMLQELIAKAEQLVQGLGLHYRLVKLAAGDVTASMATTYDIELWLPSMGEYKECSSVSNAMDYQARRGRIRSRRADGSIELVHTLNGSGLATSRLLPAILEQCQQADGSVRVPEALRKYLGVDVLR